ncbi:macrolide ABC transporter permease/ATP-binding protein MacB, partial [Pantoea agglomerans]|uniref:ABC transporter permease n=1 Tax=Enterobacter agglomerans TaxID=549 RepID=UPI00202D1EB9
GIILADEPTGALDTHSGNEVLSILRDLHRQGNTVVIVTHDMAIAEHAQRIIELRDGEVIADRQTRPEEATEPPPQAASSPATSALNQFKDRFIDAFKMALLAMNAQRMRTFLTMLGIIIGIASVVSVVALGKGSQEQVLADINSMGTSTLEIFPGKDFGDMDASAIHTLRASDIQPLTQQPYVHSVTPSISTSVTMRYGNIAVSASISGVGEQFFTVRGYTLQR